MALQAKEKPSRGCWRTARRLLAGLLIVICLLLVYTTLHATWHDRQVWEQPPPDSSLLVDVGGRDIHLVGLGLEHEGPAVVLLPCLSCGASYWQLAQPLIAERARVYAFDPAGFGWGDPHPDQVSVANAADDLHRALVALGEEEIILVPFSGSGITALEYVARYDDPRVLGIVSMEAELFSGEGVSAFGDQSHQASLSDVQRAAVAVGLGHVALNFMLSGIRENFALDAIASPYYDPEGVNRLLDTYLTRKVINAAIDIEQTYEQAVADADGLTFPPELPVFAVDCDWGPDFEGANERQAAALREGEAYRAEVWMAVAEHSQDGRYIPVEGCTHFLPVEQPEVIADIVLEMWKMVQE